jgi:hypothetical protein
VKKRGSFKKEALVGLSALAATAVVPGATVFRPFRTSADHARVLEPFVRLAETSCFYRCDGAVHKGMLYRSPM